MKKYQNTGRAIGFILDGKTYDFQDGQVVECPDNLKERMADQIAKIRDLTPEVSVAVVPKPIAKPRFTKGELEKLSLKSLQDIGKKHNLTIKSKAEGVIKLTGVEK